MGKRKWTDDDLRREIPKALSVRDLARRLGLKGTSNRRLIDRARKLGIDVSYLESIQPKGKGMTKIPDRELAEIVKSSNSISEVLVKGGYSLAGGSHAAISRRVRSLGIDTCHFNYSRSAPSRTKKSADKILILLEEGSPRARTTMLRRAMFDLGVEHKCRDCGMRDEWQGKPITLQIEHINGNRLDSRIENLCFLCPNCHTQTATYARKKTPS